MREDSNSFILHGLKKILSLHPIPDLLTFKYQGIMTEHIYISTPSLIA
jgi:hypothetical protein